MFARRKRKEDGFEWHTYVRTTIRHRREQRREALLQARRAAASQAGAAGKALLVGSRAAGAAARDGARAGFWAAGLLAQGTWHGVARGGVALAQGVAVLARPLMSGLARPAVGIPVALAGATSLGCGIGRLGAAGLDGEAALMLVLGIAALLAVLPLLSGVTGLALPRVPPRAVAACGAAIVLAAGLLAAGRGGLFAGFGARLSFSGGAATFSGRAEALGGDRLRVGSRVVRLAGVEAPEPRQRCGPAGRSWRCGAEAGAALGRLVRGRLVTCTLSGDDGVCRNGEIDIGAQMVREGHAFAASGLFAPYAQLEREARNAGVGIWSGGNVERPAEYRARVGKRSRSARSEDATGGGRS
jgi:endonuclease YncB( thermonuclease family)